MVDICWELYKLWRSITNEHELLILEREIKEPKCFLFKNILSRPPHVGVSGKSSSPVRGLEWSRGFQEVKVHRFHDNGTGRW
jgi:hypothetical protein